jgi:glycosyltransferase involved in cell wall biosynthesis
MLASAAKSHTHRWCRWLADHGHEVVLFSDKPAPATSDYTNIQIVPPRWSLWRQILHFKLSRDPLANNRHKWRAYAPAIAAAAPDIIHAQEALAYGPMLAHLGAWPRVLMPWGPDVEALAAPHDARGPLIRAAAAAADVITTNAPGLEDHWSRLLGVPADRFDFFSWGVDTARFRPAPPDTVAAMRARLGIPAGVRVVLSPRLAEPYYHIGALLEAWRLAAPTDAHLVVLRAGARDASWQRWQTEAAGLAAVTLVDALMSPAEMATVYTLADATVMIPETDLVAVSLLEALACGSIPVLAPLPCYRHLAPGDGAPHVVYTSDRTPAAVAAAVGAALAIAPADRIAKAAANRAWIEATQDWDRNAERLLTVYETARRRHASRQAPP